MLQVDGVSTHLIDIDFASKKTEIIDIEMTVFLVSNPCLNGFVWSDAY